MGKREDRRQRREGRLNDVGDDWFYDDYGDDHKMPLTNIPEDDHEASEYEDGMLESEWLERLAKLAQEAEEDRREEEEEEKRSIAARKAAETRKLNQWKKEDEERRLRRTRKFRSIDDP